MLYSIGHSNLLYEEFISLLEKFNIQFVFDVRFNPTSSYTPHFNRLMLKDELKKDKIKYAYVGKELGGREINKSFYIDDIISYKLLSTKQEYNKIIERLINGHNLGYNIAIMCSEKEPLECHRYLMIGHTLMKNNINVNHILNNGDIINQKDLNVKLIKKYKDYLLEKRDLLNFNYVDTINTSKEDLLEKAIEFQNKNIGHRWE